jgi:hypothetical protein
MFFVLLICFNTTYSQVESTSSIQLEQDEFENENIEHNEEITIKRRSKLDLNSFLNDETLSQLILNKAQIVAIRNHILNTGECIDLLELQSIGIITYANYLNLLEIIDIKNQTAFNEKTKINILNRTAYQNTKTENSIGNNWSNYQQLKITINNQLKIGFAREFDFGENNEKNPILNHYDHYAYFIQKNWTNTTLILGNFQVYHGLGMLIGQGYSSSFGNSGIQNLIQSRWLANANQTEYNNMHGFAFTHQFKTLEINFGMSKQKIDEGSTFGNHRTLNEISKKDKLNEEIILTSIVQNLSKQKHSLLLIHSKIDRKSSVSYASQFYFRNFTSFHEFVINGQNILYTSGISVLFTKNIQMSLAYTNRTLGVESVWSSLNSQGFSNTTQEGITLHMSIPIKRKWNFTISHKTSRSEKSSDEQLGIKQYTIESLRIDRPFGKQVSFTSIILYKWYIHDASKTNKAIENGEELKIRLSLKIKVDESFLQEFNCYYNTHASSQSKSLSYQTTVKINRYNLKYAIGVFEIESGVPIYFSYSNVIVQRSTLAIYHPSTVQNIGVSTKIMKKLVLSIQYTNVYNSIDRNMKWKTIINLKYN